MKLVDQDKAFTFRNACPYCGANLVYHCSGWEQNDDGEWKADQLESNCVNEPEPDSPEWEEWLSIHSQMPYVNQLPVDIRVKTFINANFIFDVK